MALVVVQLSSTVSHAEICLLRTLRGAASPMSARALFASLTAPHALGTYWASCC
jgi:hypothetical protein